MSEFINKTIVITGGGRGIGKTIAAMCAAEKARVYILSRTQRELNQTSSELSTLTGTEVYPRLCDVSNPDSVYSVFNEIQSQVGPIYGLVCAAGIYGPMGPIEELSDSEWRKCIEVNLFGTFYSIKAVVKRMKEAKTGRIVLFSGGGEGAYPRFSAYVSTKGAILRLTETVGVELAEYGIYVNAISPGPVNTRFLDDLLQAGPEKVGAEVYQKSLDQQKKGGVPPSKAGELVLYLLSEKSKGLYGKNISAVWDDYKNWNDLEALSKSKIYTMKRVVAQI